ncbi:LacI family DNA-binding transcriptional regulator [Tessaracoccus caeni]|uniref:LacI family DNA-binding transcriptional regulator n=1 Tax=Tessaracoccus caeni TaxID=3031239 RepID=UPI0023DA8E81|nr:LacI family DNA-binding transcriptional regulator [Tessaracoccus caeni]MDF1490166.1 LacI family DNA-binding transcriptional regulator [Tessaracoccus caeni]
MSKRAPAKPVATRNDVARLAKVSPAVVSYVVNRSKSVSPETEERVRKAIEMLGYRPNSTARSLRLGSTETLGMVVPDTTNPYFAALAHEVELVARERGYDLLVSNTGGSTAMERHHVERYSMRRVDGVLLCSTTSEPDARALDLVDIPLVLLNHFGTGTGVPSVGVNLYHGAQLAVEHLASHGHRRIGMVAGVTSDGRQDARKDGWFDAVRALGLEHGPCLTMPFNTEGGYEAGKLLASSELPSAIFASSDRQAIGLVHAFHEAGVAMPEDVAVIGFDGSNECAYTWPPLTTVAQPISEMAKAAVAKLLDGTPGAMHQLLEAKLVIRRSCGCSPHLA